MSHLQVSHSVHGFESYIQSGESMDLLQTLLADKRSPQTRRAYQNDLTRFFVTITGMPPSPESIATFLQLSRADALTLVLKYKAELIERGLKEATVNRSISSIKSLVRLAQKLEKCDWSLEEISGEKIKTYRDTTGVDKSGIQEILAVPNLKTIKGKRDKAILSLLFLNALRRNEVVSCDVRDFDQSAKTLTILGKGKGTQKDIITLPLTTVDIITEWLDCRGDYKDTSPLFAALDNCSYGHRLTGQAIYDLVKHTSVLAGIQKPMSPHRCRHSAITQALDMTGGDVRKVQKFSRHSRMETLMIYDDNRVNHQGEITNNLDDFINGEACDRISVWMGIHLTD